MYRRPACAVCQATYRGQNYDRHETNKQNFKLFKVKMSERLRKNIILRSFNLRKNNPSLPDIKIQFETLSEVDKVRLCR